MIFYALPLSSKINQSWFNFFHELFSFSRSIFHKEFLNLKLIYFLFSPLFSWLALRNSPLVCSWVLNILIYAFQISFHSFSFPSKTISLSPFLSSFPVFAFLLILALNVLPSDFVFVFFFPYVARSSFPAFSGSSLCFFHTVRLF